MSTENIILKNAKPVPIKDGKIFWHLDETLLPDSMSKEKVLICIQKAFDIIQGEFGHIRFQSSKENAPITIYFKPKEFFVNKLMIALANPYTDDSHDSADLYLNISLDWGEFHKPGGFNLVKVVVHELLHTLGLNHSTDPRCIMFYQYQENDDIWISDNTRQAIRDFYGMSYDVKLLTEWLKECDFLYQTNDRDVITLGKLLGLKLSPVMSKNHNIRSIKKRLGL